MNVIKHWIRALFNVTLAPLLALVLIFEEWGWEPLQRVMARLARLPLWAQAEGVIRRLPPYAAMAVLAVPMVLLLPVKLLALYAIGQGYALVGLLAIVLAKLVGTAAFARLFALTHPALMELAWFSLWYGRWMPWKIQLIARVQQSTIWRSAGNARGAVRRWIGTRR